MKDQHGASPSGGVGDASGESSSFLTSFTWNSLASSVQAAKAPQLSFLLPPGTRGSLNKLRQLHADTEFLKNALTAQQRSEGAVTHH